MIENLAVQRQRRKQVFLKELSKSSRQSTEVTNKAPTPNGKEESKQPGWGPLRDTYMMTNLKLKDWDKIQVFLPDAEKFTHGKGLDLHCYCALIDSLIVQSESQLNNQLKQLESNMKCLPEIVPGCHKLCSKFSMNLMRCIVPSTIDNTLIKMIH